MHDQRTDRPAPRGFLELVGPATVIGHRAVAELARRGIARLGGEIGVVDEEHEHLALHVDALEIVPATLGRGDAVADEDKRGLGDRGDIVGADGRDIDRTRLFERDRCRGRGEAQHARRSQPRVEQRHRLHPLPVGAAGLEPERLEARDEIADRSVFPRGPGRAALERVRRERLDRFGQAGGVDRLLGKSGGGAREERGEQSEGAERHRRTVSRASRSATARRSTVCAVPTRTDPRCTGQRKRALRRYDLRQSHHP